MSSQKMTNILLLALVVLLFIHEALVWMRPVGRYTYSWHQDKESSSASFTAFDTTTGTIHMVGAGEYGEPWGKIMNIPYFAKLHDKPKSTSK